MYIYLDKNYDFFSLPFFYKERKKYKDRPFCGISQITQSNTDMQYFCLKSVFKQIPELKLRKDIS